ncbi:MAG: hypothetical protein ACSLFQ_18050 [Thermoanaerobaculia bacterium]
MTPPDTSSAAQPVAPPWSRRLLSAAVVAIFVGLWLLLDSLGLPVPDMKVHWPSIVLLGGIASFADFALVSRRAISLAIGVSAVGFGWFFYTFTEGSAQVRQVGEWWPALPMILGASLLAGWAVQREKSLALFASGAIAAGIALSGWGAGRWPMQLVWGGVLVVIGIVFLWRTLARRN